MKYTKIIESFPEFIRWLEPNKAKLSKNLVKASYLELLPKDDNYDMKFTQYIGRRYKPSTKEWIERRNDHLITVIEDVPLNEIQAKYNWIMGK